MDRGTAEMYAEGEEEELLENIRLRRPQAEADYRRTFGRLENVNFLDPASNQAGKHFDGSLSQAAALQKSKNGPSLFFENPGTSGIQTWFWYWFSSVFEVDCNLDQLRGPRFSDFDDSTPSAMVDELWAELRRETTRVRVLTPIFLPPIGATGGEETSELILDIHLLPASGNIHGYPALSRTAGPNIKRLGYIDS